MTNQKVLLKVKNDFSKDRLVASVKELKVYFSGKRMGIASLLDLHRNAKRPKKPTKS